MTSHFLLPLLSHVRASVLQHTPVVVDNYSIRATGAHPFIDFGQLELPQPPDAVRGHAPAFAPAVNGVLGHAQVLGDLFGADPWFGVHGVLASGEGMIQSRSKSSEVYHRQAGLVIGFLRLAPAMKSLALMRLSA